MSDVLTTILPVIAAIFVASYLYVLKTTGSGLERFDLVKFLSTVITGAGIAVVMVFTGSPVSSESLQAQIVIYSGLVILVEKGLKFVIRSAIVINLSGLSDLLPPVPAPVAASPVPAPVARSGAAPVAVVPPVMVNAVNPASPNVGIDQIDKISLNFHPSTFQGVSPLTVEVFAIANPTTGPHQVTRGVIDWADGSPCEDVVFVNGSARLVHTYEYRQAGTLIDNEVSPYYAREFYPVLSAVSIDGIRGRINNEDGRSLMITVKDAEAVRLGKVSNFPPVRQ